MINWCSSVCRARLNISFITASFSSITDRVTSEAPLLVLGLVNAEMSVHKDLASLKASALSSGTSSKIPP
jgi:hypothetical protein